jgi:effector-binding domain-containing protein
VSREVEGRTVTKTIPDEAVEQIRAETEEYKHFRQLSHALIETSAQMGRNTAEGSRLRRSR